MRVVLMIDDTDMRDALTDLNDERRQDNLTKVTLKQVRDQLKDANYLRDVAEELLANTIEIVG